MGYHPKSIKLDEAGLSKVLGFLEAEVMGAVWQRKEATVRDVREALKRKKAYSFNTIMTVMNRLVEKGLLKKGGSGSAFTYCAAVERDAFLHEVTRSVVSAIVRDGTLFQVAAFVEAIKECSEDDLDALRRQIGRS
jgi:predicted transcriptional regulator